MKKTIFILVASFVTLFAQGVPYNTEFQVNTFTDYDQTKPCVTSLAGGGFVVCWESLKQDGYWDGIFGQCFENNGEKVGEEFQVNSFTEKSQTFPDVCGLKDGGFVVCWQSHAVSHDGIYGQRFQGNGDKIGPEFRICPDSVHLRQSPCSCLLPNGDFVVCWQSYEQDGSGAGIYGQRFDKDGGKIEKEFQVNTFIEQNQKDPCITSLEDGGFVVGWVSWGQDGSFEGIFAQRFKSDGKKNGQEFQVNSCTELQQFNPSICSLKDGGFIICWHGPGVCDGLPGYNIYAQFYAKNGNKIGNEFSLNTFNNDLQQYPCISSLKDGGFVVCWQSHKQDGYRAGIFCQLYDENGKYKSEFQVNDYYKYQQMLPSVCWLENGGFVVCWQSETQDGSGNGIFAKYYIDEIVHELTPFALVYPEYDSTVKVDYPTFVWQPGSKTHINLPYELNYDLYLSLTPEFKNPFIFYDINDSTYQIDGLEHGTTYYWKVRARNIAGEEKWSSVNAFYIDNNAETNAADKLVFLKSPVLYQSYPNPFNPSTTINYELPTNGSVSLKIFDITGRLVTELLNTAQQAGMHATVWNGCDQNGTLVAAGVYIYQLKFTDANGKTTILHKKMSLVK